MFCARCGKEIDNDSTFCPFCGQKTDAPVENKKNFQPSVSGNTKTVKLVGGIAAGLVILFGVIFGIGKLTGGSDTEETAEALSPSVETQESAAVESQKETDAESDTELSEVKSDTDAESDTELSEAKSDTDGTITLYSWQLEPYLRDFFDLQAEIIGKHRSKNGGAAPDDCCTIEDLLEYSGVFILDERVNLPADYNSELYESGMYESARVIANEYNKFKIRYNRPASYYDLKVDIVDSNIGSSFKYYPGTEAVIYVKLRFRFLCLDTAQYSPELWKDCPYSNDLYASFVKSTEGEKWLLKSLTTDGSAFDFEKKLTDENRDVSAVVLDDKEIQDAINAYVEIFNPYAESSFTETVCALIYLDNDNIPELVALTYDNHIDVATIWSYKNGNIIPFTCKFKNGWLVSNLSDDFDEESINTFEIREDDEPFSYYIENKGLILEKSLTYGYGEGFNYTNVPAYNVLSLSDDRFHYSAFAVCSDGYDKVLSESKFASFMIKEAPDVFVGSEKEIEDYVASQGNLISFDGLEYYDSVQDAYSALEK